MSGNYDNWWPTPTGADGLPQKAYYDPGVGTAWYDRLTGGAFGAGLSDNVQEGYDWLRRHYTPGDEVFLFGFSRGAFTARSLAEFVARCGLLKPDVPMTVEQTFERLHQLVAQPYHGS